MCIHKNIIHCRKHYVVYEIPVSLNIKFHIEYDLASQGNISYKNNRKLDHVILYFEI